MAGRPPELRRERSVGVDRSAFRRYVLIEAAIGALINAALAAAFVTAMFAGRPLVLWGVGGLVLDFVPATFLPVLAMTIALTVLTRRRQRLGRTPRIAAPPLPLVTNPVLRGLLFAGIATVVLGGAGAALMAWWWSPDASFAAIFVFKLAYGAVLGAAAAAIVVGAALRDPCSASADR